MFTLFTEGNNYKLTKKKKEKKKEFSFSFMLYNIVT